MSSNKDLPREVSDSDGWRVHELSQLRRFRALSLRRKLEAVEGMADVVRRLFQQMRREGKFQSGAHSPKLREMTKKHAVGEPSAIYRKARVPYDLELAGCAPEPLMAYLKALGVLRIVSEQKDKGARGWWKNDVFWLRSPLLFKEAVTEEAKWDALLKFFFGGIPTDPHCRTMGSTVWVLSHFFRKDRASGTRSNLCNKVSSP